MLRLHNHVEHLQAIAQYYHYNLKTFVTMYKNSLSDNYTVVDYTRL